MAGRATQRRVALSFVDQVLASGTNFATGVVVARLSGASEFGGYMLAFTVWIVVLGLHRALVTDPLIISSGKSDLQPRAIREGVTAEIILGSAVSLVVAVAGLLSISAHPKFGTPILALSPWIIPLLLQDYWRAVAFQRRRAGLALGNDLLFAAVEALAILVFAVSGWRSAGYIIAAWGLGAAAGSLLGFGWFPGFGRFQHGWHLLRRLWPLSRWTFADFSTGFASDQAYLAFVALLLSPVNYGGFRAATSFMGPTIVILRASTNVGLPEASRRVHSEEAGALDAFARRLTLAAFACVALYGTAVAVSAEFLLRAVYGDEFSRFAPLVVLSALQYGIAVLVFGQGIALKASGRMRLLWRARAVVAVASLLSMVVAVRSLGTIGAGWAGTLTGTYFAAAVYAVYRIELRQRGLLAPDQALRCSSQIDR